MNNVFFIFRKKTTFWFLVLVFIGAVFYYFLTPSGRFVLGNYFFGGGSYNLSLAQRMYESVLRKDKNFHGANYQLGRVYFIKGDFSGAWFFIEREIKNNPEFSKSYYMRGLIFGYVNYLESAETDFLKFLSYKPDSWAGWNDLAWVYFKKGDFRLMEGASRTGLLYNKNNPWLLNSLALALYNEGRNTEATEQFEESLKGFEKIGRSGWGKAYPGNDPKIYGEGYRETLETVKSNLEKAKSGRNNLEMVDNMNGAM